jgi:hypothetical protein
MDSNTLSHWGVSIESQWATGGRERARVRLRYEGLTFGLPKWVGARREVIASTSAPTSLTRILFILSSLPVSLILSPLLLLGPTSGSERTTAASQMVIESREKGRERKMKTYSIFAVR